MTLRQKQSAFIFKTSLLILYAYELGYELTYGDALRPWDCPYGHPNSNHKRKLALDLNLFIDGRYIRDDEGHKELHKYWERLGGAPMIKGDPNHYSIEHRGQI